MVISFYFLLFSDDFLSQTERLRPADLITEAKTHLTLQLFSEEMLLVEIASQSRGWKRDSQLQIRSESKDYLGVWGLWRKCEVKTEIEELRGFSLISRSNTSPGSLLFRDLIWEPDGGSLKKTKMWIIFGIECFWCEQAGKWWGSHSKRG